MPQDELNSDGSRTPPLTKAGYIDRKKVRREFLDSTYETLDEFLVARGWTKWAQEINGARWEADKRGSQLWAGVRADAFERATKLETAHFMRQVRAIERVPEQYLQLFQILEYNTMLVNQDIQHDMQLRKQAKESGTSVDEKRLRFHMRPSDLVSLSMANKILSEGLYQSLGIDPGAGNAGEQLRDKLQTKMVELEVAQEEEAIEIEVMGAGTFEEKMKTAFETYIDKPREVTKGDEQDPV